MAAVWRNRDNPAPRRVLLTGAMPDPTAPGMAIRQLAGGYLAQHNFHDFAGSTIVHSVGGWGALVAAFILGPRLGKYVDGKSRPIFGHNLPLATIGMFLLWLGWFGFNGGSVLSGDPAMTSYVLVTTCLASAAGISGAMATSWIVQKKPDLTMALNGSLAGLVGVRESPLLVSEQLTFQQTFRQCRAVHGDKRMIRSRPVIVQGLCHNFLARATFTENEHWHIRIDHAIEQLEDAQHSWRSGNDTVKGVLQVRASTSLQ